MHAEPDELLPWGATEFAEAESFELLFAQMNRSRHVSTGPGIGKSFADLLPETPDAFITSFGFIEATCVAGCQVAPAFDFDGGALVSALVMQALDRKSQRERIEVGEDWRVGRDEGTMTWGLLEADPAETPLTTLGSIESVERTGRQ